MSMVTRWSPFFQSHARMKGRSYQRAGRVSLQEPRDGELIRALVQGRELYTVTIRREGAYGVAECTCPHFESGAFCKHIWATLQHLQLDADEGSDSSVVNQLAMLRVRPPKARKRDETEVQSRYSEPEWMGRLTLLRPSSDEAALAAATLLPAQRQLRYCVLTGLCQRTGGVVLELRQRQATGTGWSRARPLRVTSDAIASLPDVTDRELVAMLLGSSSVHDVEAPDRFRPSPSAGAFRLPPGAQRALLLRLIDTGRCFLSVGDNGEYREAEHALTWDGGRAWSLWMTGRFEGDDLVVRVELRRGDERMAIDVPEVIIGGMDGLLIAHNRACAFDDREAFRWVSQFRDDSRTGEGAARDLRVPRQDVTGFLDRLYMLPQLPRIDLPDGLGREEVTVEPVAHLELYRPGSMEAAEVLPASAKNQLAGRVWFEYAGQRVSPVQAGRFVPVTPPADPAAADGAVATETRQVIRRHPRLEREAMAILAPAGLRQAPSGGGDMVLLAARQMAAAVAMLMAAGWKVAADRKALRVAGPPALSIRSGLDWFELRGTVRYQRNDGVEEEVSLPQILAAARAGRDMIELGDGSQALLPQDWLDEHGLLTTIGKIEGDHLTFRASQAAMLDALLDARQLVDVDEHFQRVRERLHAFDGIEPLEAAPGFNGQLRRYQREGLGWLAFLRWFGMGGILADDMGLGKTIQVLAMLHARRQGHASGDGEMEPAGQERLPSLIVVPRSVVFNWMDEATKFTPHLRVAAYTGPDRHTLRADFTGQDLIVTSYGLLRRDIEDLRHHSFDYVVLDEAQAIKNPASQAAKAARLLHARHRLALTGTPIENHLGDLWSIFEYLNPGMLGSGAKFAELIKSASTRSAPTMSRPDAAPEGQPAQPPREALTQIARTLRPFILRRTKKQVLTDLPPKTEQTILCEMEDEQRRTYDDLRQYYRGNLLRQLDAAPVAGLGQSTFMVLEALLRLRQAACHPGLIDPARADEPSAKLDALLERVDDIIDEGSKALVFSQFTSMLALVRRQLDKRGIRYAYLDGQTRNREEVVKSFQNDESNEIPLFLISLKTGGLGLNLTAAEYVFILDPWWNPAVEAQAIDRAHRIGQTKPVFAYRMICQDTVEQRIAELQAQKQQLADAIVGAEENLLQSLTKDDLERLLS